MDTGTKDTQSDTSSIDTLHNVIESIEKPVKQAMARDSKGRLLPGVSGNPAGAPKKEESVTKIIRSRLNQPCDYCRDMTWAEAIAKRELEQSLNDPDARRHLLDRLEGRAIESIKLGSDGTVIPITIVEVIRGYPTQGEGRYVKEDETKQIENNLTITSPDNNSAPFRLHTGTGYTRLGATS